MLRISPTLTLPQVPARGIPAEFGSKAARTGVTGEGTNEKGRK